MTILSNMKKINIIAVILLGSIAVFAQPDIDIPPFAEKIDGWYGRKISELEIQLKNKRTSYKIDFSASGQYSVEMTDYRGVKVLYIAQEGTWITHRIDKYSRKQYKARMLEISNEWKVKDGFYILHNKVIAIENPKTLQIAFIPGAALPYVQFDGNHSKELNFIRLVL